MATVVAGEAVAAGQVTLEAKVVTAEEAAADAPAAGGCCTCS